jgi:hypothetical protein
MSDCQLTLMRSGGAELKYASIPYEWLDTGGRMVVLGPYEFLTVEIMVGERFA